MFTVGRNIPPFYCAGTTAWNSYFYTRTLSLFWCQSVGLHVLLFSYRCRRIRFQKLRGRRRGQLLSRTVEPSIRGLLGMQRNSSTGMNSDGSFLEDLEPRKPPPIPNYPLPYGLIDKPRPLVPDVSLIFDNPGTVVGPHFPDTSLKSTSPTHKSESSPVVPISTPRSQSDRGGQTDSLKQELSLLTAKIYGQESVISRIELKLDKILEFQEKLAAHLNKTGDVRSPVSSKDVRNPSPKNKQACIPDGLKNQKCSSDSGSSLTNSTPVNRRINQNNESPTDILQRAQRSNVRGGSSAQRKFNMKSPGKSGSKVDEDLSAILKDIQLPNMNEPSVYSDVSGIKSLELLEYNDDSFRSESGVESPILGASASAFGSSISSEDEGSGGGTLKPSATFYNNVLGNVNRLLQKGNETEGKITANTPSGGGRLVPCEQKGRRGNIQQVVQSNGSRSSSSSGGSNFDRSVNTVDTKNDGEAVVEATKRYLEKMGVQFESPSPAERQLNLAAKSNNYMIQQNVYNSIYIPTVNCVPPMTETIDSNGTSGNFQTLARKYVPEEDLQQYGSVVAGPNGNVPIRNTDTSVYGMSSSNLSFATKQYLQRYGLVNQESDSTKPLDKPNRVLTVNKANQSNNDRILDITAIQQQPKLL